MPDTVPSVVYILIHVVTTVPLSRLLTCFTENKTETQKDENTCPNHVDNNTWN